MNVRASSLPAVLLGVTALLIAIGLFPADSTSAHTGGNNPDHLSVTIRPGNWTSTTSSTPFGSSHTENCGSSHSVDYCHHHSLPAFDDADWSMDIDTDEDDLVYFNVNWSSAGTGDYLKGYLYDVSPECDEEDPAGYEVFVEVWAYDSPNGWRKLGFINYDHLTVSPVLDPGAWFDPGEYLGKTEDYTHYTNCFTGPHLHQDHYNYEHFAKWTDKAWNGETLYQTTAIGFLGGTGDTGPDGHGGSWVGW